MTFTNKASPVVAFSEKCHYPSLTRLTGVTAFAKA
jgi:hypothetical protein